ncbi:MAG: glycogen/starch synthase [Bacillota bacterium]
MNDLLAIIDATRKEQLDILTLHRMPGALPFAGKYRLIDFTLSNIKHAGIKNVAIFPYGNYRSLQDHIGSGKRWDLDRRRDGLFILPPKNMHDASQEMLSFQRMNEHIEHFRRSMQPYVLITQANIVWNIDFVAVLEDHIQSGADITEIISEKVRLKSFIIAKEHLLKYIKEYDILPYKNLNEVIAQSPNITVRTHTHKGYVRYITDTFNYMKANLDMLRFDKGTTIFTEERPIMSKEKTAPPARYEDTATVSNSLIASGCIISGTVKNSIIGRDSVVKKGAYVKNSIIMGNAIIEEDSTLHYAILDKSTVIKKATIIEGTLREPYVTQKEQIVKEQSRLHILHAASEAYPLIKRGGLADVIGGLTEHLVKQGTAVSVILPLYRPIKDRYEESYKNIFTELITYDEETYKITVHKMTLKQVNYYFVEHFKFFERDDVYGYEDDCDRFAFFTKAVATVYKQIDQFDLIHLHDWHLGLLPLYLKQQGDSVKTLLTLHNIDYQGICPVDITKRIGLDYTINPNVTTINTLKTGIDHANKLSTVSPTYRDQLRYETYGNGLTPALLKRERDFYGILNGIQTQYAPHLDNMLISNYNKQDLSPKTDNKLFLQKQMHLAYGFDKFIIAVISRITEQKGFNIMIPALDQLLETHPNVQFVLLGQGDETIVARLKILAEKYPKRVTLNIGYDSANPSHIYAGADAFLMPSRVEPCGLSQMIAMRYGTLPIVHSTGGLADTVKSYDPITKAGNGFSFYSYSIDACYNSLIEAYSLYTTDKPAWKKMMRRAMEEDFSLDRQATKMLELYHLIIEN